MIGDKVTLLQEMDASRERLWSILRLVDQSVDVYPGWNKRDFFAHIAGWEAVVFESLRAHITGNSSLSYQYVDVDTANKDFVAARQNFTAASAQIEADAYRFAIRAMLSEIAAAQYGDLIRFPWGEESISNFLQGAIDHERNHADEIARL